MNFMGFIKSVFCGSDNLSAMRNQITGFTKADPIVIVDVGCRWGFAERFLGVDHQQRFKIYGFDPDALECARLKSSYQSLPEGYISCIPLGLAGASGKRNLYLTKEPACSSLHPPIQFLADEYPALECIKLERVVSVDVISLNEWATDAGLKSIDYIKIDTQGSELEILKGADKFLGTTRCIDIEVEFNPIYEGQSLFGETDIYLRSNGFVLWRLSNLVHYSLGGELLLLKDPNFVHFDTNIRQETDAYGGQIYWADARYVHTDVLKKTIVTNDQFGRDAVLFGALGMQDVVNHINKIQAIARDCKLDA